MLEGNEELERFLASRRRTLAKNYGRPPHGAPIYRWLVAWIRFCESQIAGAIVQALALGAAFILLFTLKQLSAHRLSKRGARTCLRVARTLQRASLKVLRHELKRHI